MKTATIAHALRLRRSGAISTGACPACGYKGAFTVRDLDGRTLVRCHVGCDQAEVLAALRRAGLWGSALRRMPLPAPGMAAGASKDGGGGNTALAVERLWSESQALPGTLAESYLLARGIAGAPPNDLRFLSRHRHRPTDTEWPVMLAAARNAAGDLVAVHRTYLRTDGAGKAAVEPAKMTLGPVGGAAVHLACAGPHLVVGEGIESTLSAMAGAGLPGWAALSAGGIRSLVLPALPLAARVTIAADADAVGLAAARDAAMRWTAERRAVFIAEPPLPFTDWNDAIRAEVAHD